MNTAWTLETDWKWRNNYCISPHFLDSKFSSWYRSCDQKLAAWLRLHPVFNCHYIGILQGVEPHTFWIGSRHFWFAVEDPSEITGAHLINAAWHPRAEIPGKEVTRLGWKFGNSILRRNQELVSEVVRQRGWKPDCGRQSSKKVTPADTYQCTWSLGEKPCHLLHLETKRMQQCAFFF